MKISPCDDDESATIGASWRLIIHGHEGSCVVDQHGICTLPDRVPRHPDPPRRKGFKGGKPRY